VSSYKTCFNINSNFIRIKYKYHSCLLQARESLRLTSLSPLFPLVGTKNLANTLLDFALLAVDAHQIELDVQEIVHKSAIPPGQGGASTSRGLMSQQESVRLMSPRRGARRT